MTRTAREDEPVILTRQEIKDIAREAARETVREAMTQMGVQHDNPLEMQRDFQFVRDFREGSTSAKNKGIVVLIGVVGSGLMTACWLGIKAMLSGRNP